MTSKPTADTTTKKKSRHTRRRQRTRDALIAAATLVMAKRGFDNATISEITEEADVGMGSFYNHFESKDDIMRAAAAQILSQMGDELDALIAGVEDMAEAQALAVRGGFEFSIKNSDFGKFVLKNGLVSTLIDSTIKGRVERDLRLGAESGRFKIRNMDVTVRSMLGITSAINASVLSGELDNNAVDEEIVLILLMLGLSEEESRVIMERSKEKYKN